MTKYLCHGYAVTFLTGDQKPLKLVHPACRNDYQRTVRGLMWVNSYEVGAPYDLVSRFALCAHCNHAIRNF